MEVIIRQITCMEKIRSLQELEQQEITRQTLLQGEHFAYQIGMYCEQKAVAEVCVTAESGMGVTPYIVKNIIMDYPTAPEYSDDDYLTKEAGSMPDMLLPLAKQNHRVSFSGGLAVLWVDVELPEEIAPGNYTIRAEIRIRSMFGTEKEECICKEFVLTVLPVKLPAQRTFFTQWVHLDCIAQVHGTEVYSEKHWELIEKYIALAARLGINTVLTPIITPPLDTREGCYRACTQLLRITKCGEQYRFDFSLLKRFLDLCLRCGIRYFEICQLFSQGGLKYTPNIKVWENGEESYQFGWHKPYSDPSYREFLQQMLPALLAFLEEAGVKERCFFHISDEPHREHLEAYTYAYRIIKPLLGDCEIMDALSDVDFYEQGLMSIPVTSTDHIEPFLARRIEKQWAYYCCGQGIGVGNRFFAMASYRNRILGLQLYLYDVKGFLHWGYNYYNGPDSIYTLNPYVSSSAGMAFPSGDAFSVYPYGEDVVPSLRAVIFRDALEDIRLCQLLEAYVGKAAVVALIEEEAGQKITFSSYPRNNVFGEKVMNRIREEIAIHIS